MSCLRGSGGSSMSGRSTDRRASRQSPPYAGIPIVRPFRSLLAVRSGTAGPRVEVTEMPWGDRRPGGRWVTSGIIVRAGFVLAEVNAERLAVRAVAARHMVKEGIIRHGLTSLPGCAQYAPQRRC